MRRNTLLLLSTFGLIVSVITLVAQLSLILQPTPAAEVTANAYASGEASFCLNTVPRLNITCDSTMSQNTTYTCLVNGTDPNGDGLTFWTNNTVFNITPDGLINFTPQNKDVGNHSVIIILTDHSGCLTNSTNATFNFSVANINDPPYLIQDIPDVKFPPNATISAFFLNNYFRDPDNDPLNYTSTTPSGFSLTIMPNAEVRLTGNVCDNEDIVIFTASDPSNASAESNTVELKVDCSDAQSPDEGDGEGNGGGGGGGAFVCRENWECDDWFACLPSGVQWRRCYDLGGCEGEKYLKRSCEYVGPPPACQENWLCTEWGNCLMNSTQYRTCQDLAGCGTIVALPPTAQSCVYIATCNDGVRNGNETGVDCGGECAACALIDQPAPFNERGLATWMLILIMLSVLIASGVIHYYRAQIAQGLALLGFMLERHTYKDILVDATTRKSYFERLLAFEQLLGTPAGKEMKPAVVYNTLATLMRQYYVDALGVHPEALPEEIDAAMLKLKLRPQTREMLNTFSLKLPIIEQEDLEYDESFVLSSIEELRTIVCLTSDYSQEELMRPQEELAVSDKMSFYDEIFTRMINAMRACQFKQFEAAEREYLMILMKYDALSEEEKEQIYPEMHWLFETVKFSSEITGAKEVKKAVA